MKSYNQMLRENFKWLKGFKNRTIHGQELFESAKNMTDVQWATLEYRKSQSKKKK